jgi:hypothetical protein
MRAGCTHRQGGQTGVDRAALDVALELGIPIGGHLPIGRKDENGDVLPDKCTGMQETDTDDVNVRTELNVQDSDATLIFSHGALFGGSEYTERMARKHGKPCLHIDFDKHDADQAVLLVRAWLSETQPRVLNVAGPRASADPAIYSQAKCVLAVALASGQSRRSQIVGQADSEKADRPACPVCGGQLLDIRRKLCCVQCHSIIETCCD